MTVMRDQKMLTALMVVTVLATGGRGIAAPVSTNPTASGITFTGHIVNNTCVARLSPSVVDFCDIPRENFTWKLSVGKTKDFEITFTDCAGLPMSGGDLVGPMGVTIGFTGPDCTEPEVNYGNYINMMGGIRNPEDEGNAKGVGVTIFHQNDLSSQMIELGYKYIMPCDNPDDDSLSYYRFNRYHLQNPAGKTLRLQAAVFQTSETPPVSGTLQTTGTIYMTYR